jgi:hypothetical protein
MAPNILALKVKPVFRPDIVSESSEKGDYVPTKIQVGGIDERAEADADYHGAYGEDIILDGVGGVDRERLE